MQRHYGIELGALWRGEMSLRRVRVLIEHLPVDSLTAHALAGVDGPLAQWSLTDLLIGRLSDELAAFRWQWESAHIDRKRQRLRAAPESVLPQVETGRSADVVPLVSPHTLGGFINEQEGA